MIGYFTLDCRDDTHEACEFCHCSCHGILVNPNLPRYRRHAERWWAVWSLVFVAAIVALIMLSAAWLS